MATGRISLKDTTFLIPVRIDSEERLKNINILIKYLTRHLDTHIIILEADKAGRLKVDTNDAHYLFVKDTNTFLHRTRYNNMMAKMATTPIIALQDTDIILPVSQIIKAAALIRSAAADYASPYDGTFINTTRAFKVSYADSLDPALNTSKIGEHFTWSERSYGGCVFLNRKHFLMAGGENEHFTSWGPEDQERAKRMQILGMKVARVEGALFHLSHPRNINSGYPTTDLQMKLMKEYFSICSMEKKTLESYINTWSWKQ